MSTLREMHSIQAKLDEWPLGYPLVEPGDSVAARHQWPCNGMGGRQPLLRCIWTLAILAGWGMVAVVQSQGFDGDLPSRARSGYVQLETPEIEWQFRSDSRRSEATSERPDGSRQVEPLDEGWRVATVPAPWESFLGSEFDGSGTYRFQLSAEETDRLLVAARRGKPESDFDELHLVFDGVATIAEVRANGVKIGEHIGPWTPWSCRMDQALQAGQVNTIEVHVDEKVGHHTQGFLPVFLPHFGGIWRPVRWELRPRTRVDFDRSLVSGTHSPEEGGTVVFDLNLKNVQVGQSVEIQIHPPRRAVGWNTNESGEPEPIWEVAQGISTLTESRILDADSVSSERCRFTVPLPNAVLWAPETPWLYTVVVSLRSREVESTVMHQAVFRIGVRRYQTDGHRLLVNGVPVILQGLLNWGYVPPGLAPTFDSSQMFTELAAAQDLGLNMMKFCLWIPPKRYLELTDELGVLTWIEYPTWHAQLVESNLEELSREYREFTEFDRNHPSVILRSLTCETGPSADLKVIRSLYDLVHDQVPGAIVEDDSSWISWNRVSDIWDDHPYGNNHTWVATLGRLRDFIAAREAKPLVLGEAIAADTWPDLDAMERMAGPFLEQYPLEKRPYWYFGFHESARDFERQLGERGSSWTRDRMKNDSSRYANLMRKYQIETYRREIPWGGYILSVIRDFPFAAMGVLDSWGNFKARKSQAESWVTSQAMLVSRAPGDRRSWSSGEDASVDLLLAMPGLEQRSEAERHVVLEWELRSSDAWDTAETATSLEPGGQRPVLGVVRSGIHGQEPWYLERRSQGANDSSAHPCLSVTVPMPVVSMPEPYDVVFRVWASDKKEELIAENSWTWWVFPKVEMEPLTGKVRLDPSLNERQRDWFQGRQYNVLPPAGDSAAVVVASRLSLELLDAIEAGQSVLLLPDGTTGSLPTQSHWFLRGGPLVFEHPILGAGLAEQRHADSLVDLQHFDLAGDAHMRFDYWEACSPILTLWDNHDIKDVRVHGLAWEAKIGSGRLLVSALNHDPKRSAAGAYLLGRFLLHLDSAYAPKAWSPELRKRLRSELLNRDLDLTHSEWRFRVDADGSGLDAGWNLPRTPTDGWESIRIDTHWDGQGHGALDGWAWYATEVTVPADWATQELYLCFTGVDDHYRAFVDGVEIGTAGIIETKETAFELRTSHRLPDGIRPGQTVSVRIAVYDWYGAGGIFRPIYLRTTPLPETSPMLKR